LPPGQALICVGDKDVEGLRLGEEFRGTSVHAVQGHEIELGEVDSVRGYDVGQCGLDFGKVISRELESYSRRMESTSCFYAEA